ncbi:MAG: hypothetical protein IIC08_03910 [Proteobacteria bacterium]|nr:hypothetical protein [Pseudomonadota bacterium]
MSKAKPDRKTAWDKMKPEDREGAANWMRKHGAGGYVPGMAKEHPLAKSNKFGARKHIEDGFTFDSGLEHQRYQWLKAQPYVEHIDVHPIVTIDAGKHGRVSLDFGVWIDLDFFNPPIGPAHLIAQLTARGLPRFHLEDVKSWAYFDESPSKHIRKTEFMRMWQRFDNAHCASPLWIVTRPRGWKHGWLVKRRGLEDFEDLNIPGPKGKWR